MTTDRTRLAESETRDRMAPLPFQLPDADAVAGDYSVSRGEVGWINAALVDLPYLRTRLALALAVVEAARKAREATKALNLLTNTEHETSARVGPMQAVAAANLDLDQALAAFDGGRA